MYHTSSASKALLFVFVENGEGKFKTDKCTTLILDLATMQISGLHLCGHPVLVYASFIMSCAICISQLQLNSYPENSTPPNPRCFYLIMCWAACVPAANHCNHLYRHENLNCKALAFVHDNNKKLNGH